jgi:hypothetical protein
MSGSPQPKTSPQVWRKAKTCPYCDQPDTSPHTVRSSDGRVIYCPVAGPIIH